MIAVTAISDLVVAPAERVDARPFLREKKSKKYMGLQDELAVVCVGRALAAARLSDALPAERTGLFMAVGYIPFREEDIAPVLEGSLDERGNFDMRRFAVDGYTRAHPLLAFRCLPNMPAFHVAANFGIEGPYFVGYPSAGQLFLALEQARAALDEGRIDVAIVVGVAHQRNLLVEHHFRRIEPPVPASELEDAAAAVVLERRAHAGDRGAAPVGWLERVTCRYRRFDPLAAAPLGGPLTRPMAHRGPAAPLIAVAEAWRAGASEVLATYHGRDGIAGSSLWRKEPA